MRPHGKNQDRIEVRVPQAHRKALDDYAQELTNETGENINLSDLVRKAIKDFLKSVDRIPTKKTK